jgi:hypothetical protein
MNWYAISYPGIPATIVDADTYDSIVNIYPTTQVLFEGTERACYKYVEENVEDYDRNQEIQEGVSIY